VDIYSHERTAFGCSFFFIGGETMVDSTKYVVLDIETNGLSAEYYDLLSISIYKPDDQKVYNRFFPLEKNEELFQTEINGITNEMLEGATPLNQQEVDTIIKEFDLENRQVLTYGSIDERFLKKYFQTHFLNGIEKFSFYLF
jgi:DNA polymerase III alpha subunit (gram-positive type)